MVRREKVERSIQPKFPYREAGVGGGGRERHFDKLVPVCGNVFKSWQPRSPPPENSASHESPQEGALLFGRSSPPNRRRFPSSRRRKGERERERNPPLFFQAALCLLNSFYLGTIRARAYPIIDFISFHGRCFRGEKRDVERKREREGTGLEGTRGILPERIGQRRRTIDGYSNFFEWRQSSSKAEGTDHVCKLHAITRSTLLSLDQI